MKRKITVMILVIAGCLLLGLGFYHLYLEKHAGDSLEELQESVKETQTPTPTEQPTITPEPTDTPTPETTKEPIEVPVDFAGLQAINSDIYAWITIPDTNIDYPILQGEDNAFYLDHSYDGSYAYEGSIYTENYNTKTFEDPNTLIYGHNMANGSMFRDLHQFENGEFFDSHKDITIYMPNKILHYKVFAAYTTDDRHIMLSYDFSNKDVYTQYLQSIMEIRDMSAHIDDTVELNSDSKIITLSTCTSSDSDRYLVQAVLVSIEE